MTTEQIIAELETEAQARVEQAISNNGRGATVDTERKFLLDASLSDEGNAQCVNFLYPGQFLYCRNFGKQPWLYYTGKYWTNELAEARLDRAVTNMLLKRAEYGLQAGVDNDGKLKQEKLVKFCVTNAYRRQGCKDQLKSILEILIGEFDDNPNLLNCANGVVDLRTGDIVNHSPRQRFSYVLPVAYNPQADYDFWVTWLREALGGDANTLKYLQQAVGYSLTGRTSEECLFYLYGPTRAGKGTFTETLLNLLGKPLASGVDFATFTAKRDHDSQNFDLAGLKATRFIIASESNKYEILNAKRIKSVTGGDVVRCAHKHGDFFEYFPQFKVWLISNNPVKADSEDDALWARVNVIEFPNSYLGKEDKGLKRKMLQPDNLGGVLRWAIEGARDWYNSLPEGIQKPVGVISETERQRASNDFSTRFLDECVESAPGAFLPNKVWKIVYQAWCDENSMTPKEAKVRDALVNKFDESTREYVDHDYVKTKGYDGIIERRPGENKRERGFLNARIPSEVLREYL
jgi:putative DNA primase/helicase